MRLPVRAVCPLISGLQAGTLVSSGWCTKKDEERQSEDGHNQENQHHHPYLGSHPPLCCAFPLQRYRKGV